MPESVPSAAPPRRRAWWGDLGVRTKILTAVGAGRCRRRDRGRRSASSALGTSAATQPGLYAGNMHRSRGRRGHRRTPSTTPALRARNAALTPPSRGRAKINDTTHPRGRRGSSTRRRTPTRRRTAAAEEQALVGHSRSASYDQYVDATPDQARSAGPARGTTPAGRRSTRPRWPPLATTVEDERRHGARVRARECSGRCRGRRRPVHAADARSRPS